MTASTKNKMYRVPLADPSAIAEINLPQGMIIEPDGIEVDGNQLAVVNLGRIAGSISLLNMTSDWSAGMPAGNPFPTGSIFPTAVTKADDGFYVNQSYFNFPAYSNNPTQYLVSKASFDASVRYSGSASEIPRINTPVIPRGYGDTYPDHFLADCTDGLAGGVPDMRGDWAEATVTVNGESMTAATQPYSERIEQCGNRVIVVSNGVIHDLYRADGTMYSGVNDINSQGQPIHSTGLFSGNTLTLTPVLPTAQNMTAPDVTRELMTDDGGNDVLRFFNTAMVRSVYMTR